MSTPPLHHTIIVLFLFRSLPAFFVKIWAKHLKFTKYMVILLHEAIKIARQEQGGDTPCPLTRKNRPSIPTALQPHACSCYYTPFFTTWQVPGGQFLHCSSVGMGSSIPIAALFFCCARGMGRAGVGEYESPLETAPASPSATNREGNV